MNESSIIKNDLKIVKLNSVDVIRNTDHLTSFKNLVLSNENMYPSIDKWFNNKVLPGLKTSERVGYIGYLNELPVISAVLKKGKQAKFCHLKIDKSLQDDNLGEAFFALMTLEARQEAQEIHFTLPESLWDSKKEFFQSFGFKDVIKSKIQYRLFEEELKCTAPYNIVQEAVLRKLPKLARKFSIDGHSMANSLLMSIKPENAEKIFYKDKKVEIRRKFSTKWIGEDICIYASQPSACLMGEALIKNVVKGSPEYIWEEYHTEINSTKKDFDDYVNSLEEVYAIEFDKVKAYRVKVPISQLMFLGNSELVPPQSYQILEKSESWSQAVSMAALLHGSKSTGSTFSKNSKKKEKSNQIQYSFFI